MAGRGVNKVILIGNLGADPELRYTPSGAAVASFRMATGETWTDANGEKQERTEWHNIVAWRKLAEICGEFLKKGSQVYVEGRLQTRSWEGKDGVQRYTTEVVARNLQMLGSRPVEAAPEERVEAPSPEPHDAGAEAREGGAGPQPPEEDDELPF